MLIVRRDKYDERELILSQSAQYIKAAESRHLHVQEYKVGRMSFDCSNSFVPIRALAKQLNVRLVTKQGPDTLAGERFVINN
jgi:hypothetical protein